MIFFFVFFFIQPATAALKKCIDDKGRAQYYDKTPPQECLGKETVEMSDHGVVLKKTGKKVGAKEAADRAKHEDAKKKNIQERKRLDTALLATYTDKKEIDLARDRNIEPAELAIKGIESQLKVSQSRLDVLQLQLAESRKTKSSILPSINKEITTAKRKVELLKNKIAKRKIEIKKIKTRFDSDKKRFIELKQGNL
jgi:hypothetical protein